MAVTGTCLGFAERELVLDHTLPTSLQDRVI